MRRAAAWRTGPFTSHAVYAKLPGVALSWKRVWRTTGGLLVFCGALLSLFAMHRYSILTQAGQWVSWSESFGQLAAYFIGWMPLSALLLFVAARLPLADERRFRNLGVAIVAVIAVAILRIVVTTILLGDPHDAAAPRSLATFRRNLVEMRYAEQINAAFYMACFTAFTAHRVAVERARRSDQLEARLAQAELRNLRAQLQPHFLFNALNAVTALIRKNPEAAEQTLGHLSDLLRRSLDSTERQLVPLAREIDFVERYIAIQHVRYGDRLRTTIDVDPAVRAALVPSMILQPLVENAVRHSIARCEGGSISLHAHGEKGGVRIAVTNDAGNGGKDASDDGFGIGIANARARLEHLFGSDASLTIIDQPGSFSVVITIARMRA
jgi:two-component system LytT family sensor kinase